MRLLTDSERYEIGRVLDTLDGVRHHMKARPPDIDALVNFKTELDGAKWRIDLLLLSIQTKVREAANI